MRRVGYNLRRRDEFGRSAMYTSTLKLAEDVDMQKLEAHLVDCLRHVGAHAIGVDEHRVSFTNGGVFRIVSHWGLLTPIGFGDVAIDPAARQIKNRLSFRQLLVASTTLFGFVALSIWHQAHSWELIKLLPLMWLVLVGLNVVIGISRFNDFLTKAAETAPRSSQ